MAAALEPRGGVLTSWFREPGPPTLPWPRWPGRLLRAAAISTGIMAAAVTAAWRFPELPVRALLKRAPLPPATRLEVRKVSGSLTRLTLSHVQLRFPEGRLQARSVTLVLDWRALLRRRAVFDQVTTEGVLLDLTPEPAGAGVSPSAPAQGSRLERLEVRRLRLSDASARWRRNGRTWRVDAVSAEAALSQGRLALRSAELSSEGLSARAQGTFALNPASGRIFLEGRGPASGLRLRLDAASDGRWKALLTLARFSWTRLPSALLPLSGQVSGSSAGTAAWRLNAGEADVSGQASFDGAAVQGETTASARGATFLARGSGRLDTGDLEGSWTLTGSTRAAVRFGFSAKTLKAAGTLKGKWPELRATAALDASEVRRESLKVERMSLEFSGTKDKHRLSISLKNPTSAVVASGLGRLDQGNWVMVWDRLTAGKDGGWKAAAPFSTVYGPGREAISDLALVSGTARLTFDGGSSGRRWRYVRLKAKDLELSTLKDLGLGPQTLTGLLNAEVSATRDDAQPQGTFNFRLDAARASGRDLGRWSGLGRFEKGLAEVESLRWETEAGSFTVRGTFPTRLDSAADFDVRLRSLGGGAPFSLETSALALKGATIWADLRLARRQGALKAQGRLLLQATGIDAPPAGLAVTGALLDLRGLGDKLVVTRSLAKTKKGTLTAEGELGSSGPALKLTGRDLPFDEANFSGRADLDLILTDSWKKPALKGEVRVKKGTYTRGKKKRKEAAAPPSEGPVAMEVRVLFDQDVWYKDGPSAVEARGDLIVRKLAGTPTGLSGRVSLVRGRFGYYGRLFSVEAGHLEFKGEVPPNPEVNIRALYVEERSKTKVRLAVDGPLDQLRLTMSSEPPMEERDILSVLVFGRPLEDVGKKDQQGYSEGQEAAAKLIAAYAAQQLRGRLSLDLLEVRASGPGNPGVTVGRYVTKDLFLTYGVDTLGQRTMGVEYTVSPLIGLEGQNSSGGHYFLDLFLRKGFR